MFYAHQIKGKAGAPRHPLYQPYSRRMVPFEVGR